MNPEVYIRRYRQLLERALIDLRLAGDAGRAAGLPTSNVARIRREIDDLLKELEKIEV
jgi:hypothetical protein